MNNPTPTSNERVLPTMNKDGTRRWIHPKLFTGKLHTQRKWLAYFLMLIFVVLPYLRWNGKHLFLLDLTARRFTIFGFTFFPTDTLILWLSLLAIGLAIFLFTALFGRVWCGWACPQTVYMEFLFRPIEHWLEGPPAQRLKRDKESFFSPIRLLKYAIFLLIAAILANSFLAYFVSPEVLWIWVRESPFKHPAPFLVMLITTLLIFFDFAYFREQTCLVACPYGRIQSALLDRNTLIVGYDPNRGEPRGRAAQRKTSIPPSPSTQPIPSIPPSPSTQPIPSIPPSSSTQPIPSIPPSSSTPSVVSFASLATSASSATSSPSADVWGDCIDCGACVTACPMGIDIRDGLQMECINCAQCIDACDAIMTKVNKPKGLIRYASQAEIEGGPRLRLKRPRTLVYSVLILFLFSVLAFAMTRTSRTRAEASILRAGSEPYQLLGDGSVSNHLHIRVANRTASKQSYRIEIIGPKGRPLRSIIPINPIEIDAYGLDKANVFTMIPRSSHDQSPYTVKIRVSDNKGFSWERNFPLIGPPRQHKPATTRPSEPSTSIVPTAHRPSAPFSVHQNTAPATTRASAPSTPTSLPSAATLPIAPPASIPTTRTHR